MVLPVWCCCMVVDGVACVVLLLHSCWLYWLCGVVVAWLLHDCWLCCCCFIVVVSRLLSLLHGVDVDVGILLLHGVVVSFPHSFYPHLPTYLEPLPPTCLEPPHPPVLTPSAPTYLEPPPTYINSHPPPPILTPTHQY